MALSDRFDSPKMSRCGTHLKMCTFFGAMASNESSSHFQITCCDSRANAFSISRAMAGAIEEARILPPQLIMTTPCSALSSIALNRWNG